MKVCTCGSLRISTSLNSHPGGGIAGRCRSWNPIPWAAGLGSSKSDATSARSASSKHGQGQDRRMKHLPQSKAHLAQQKAGLQSDKGSW